MSRSPKKVFSGIPNSKPSKNPQKTIHALSDDELFIVFSFVGLTDQMIIRKVCRRWRTLIGYCLARRRSLSFVDNTENVVDWKYERWFEVVGPHKQFTKIHFPNLNSSLKKLLPLCPNVKDLDLECYELNTHTMKAIAGKCKSLERINLDSCSGFTFHLSKCLGKYFKQLRVVNLSCVSQITDNILAKLIQSVPQMVALNVCGTDINGHCLSSLKKNLFHLNISYCWKLENSGLTALTQSEADNLQELVVNNFNFQSELANSCLAAICAKFPQLRRLDMKLGSCVENDFSISTLQYTGLSAISRLQHLKTLVIRRICVLDDASLREILVRCPLEELEIDMFNQSGVTDWSISSLPNCPDLRVLELSNNQQISADMMKRVIPRLPKLNRLVLRFTNVTNDVIESAVNHCPELRSVCLNGCPQITRESLLSFFPKVRANPRQKYDFTAIHSGINSAAVHPRRKTRLHDIPNNIEFKVSTGRTRQYLWFESGRFYYSRKPDLL